MKRACMYARYSTDLQRRESVEDQLRIDREAVKRKGWKEAGAYYDEAISGDTLILREGIRQLLKDAQAGKFDVVVAESLDRISRDQADIATLFKYLRFYDVSIFTLAEGEITELQVGFNGAMNAIFLKDLAAKVRRGLRGRVESGKSGGGNCYGYDVVRQFSQAGEVIRGERQINLHEALIVLRIFREFAAGVSPVAIAGRLNAEGIPGPRGQRWTDGVIRGQASRGTGIINNEMYIGRRIWNRLRYIKDPSTGKRVSRRNPQSEWVVSDVPELRIVDDDLWHQVKERQRQISESCANAIAGTRAYNARNRLNLTRRPKTLLSGLIYCGCCGGLYCLRGSGRFACSNHISRGTCANSHSILRDTLERRVLVGIKDRMMEPNAVAEALRSFAEEANRLNQERRTRTKGWQRELAKIERQIEHLLEAIADGMYHSSLKAKMDSLESRKKELTDLLAEMEVSYAVPDAIPNASSVYASKVAQLMQALDQPDERSAAKEAIRSLIDKIVVTPGRGRGEMDAVLHGELGNILNWTSHQTLEKASETGIPGLMQEGMSVSVVAGVGFEPTTFRL